MANHIAVQKKERNEIKPRKLRSMRRRTAMQKIVVVVVVVGGVQFNSKSLGYAPRQRA